MKKNKKLVVATIVFAIFLLGLFLRVYKVGEVPASLNWDETASAYNAFTIFSWGKDEWGNKFPLIFKSFGDDKHLVHIYLTAPFVGFLGNTIFAARISSVLVGSISVLFAYLIGKYMLGSVIAGIFASLFLSISMYSVYYSRGLWETNFALSFLIIGLGVFFYSLRKKNKFIPISFVFFGLSLLSYHSSKIVILALVPLLVILYAKDLIRNKKIFAFSILVFCLFIFLLTIEPKLLGTARIGQTKFSKDDVSSTMLYQKTDNYLIGYLNYSFNNYKKYFTWDYLVESGDQSARGYLGDKGQIGIVMLVLSVVGVISLIFMKKVRPLVTLVVWLLVSPVAGALSSVSPHAVRTLFILGPFVLASAAGVSGITYILGKKIYIYSFAFLIVLVLVAQIFVTYREYLDNFNLKNPHDWQGGMEEIVSFIQKNSEYKNIFMTKEGRQPYIYFLYYLAYPLPKLLDSVTMTRVLVQVIILLMFSGNMTKEGITLEIGTMSRVPQ